MPSVPVPDTELVEGWQIALEKQVQQGDLTETMRKTFEWGFAQFMDWLQHNGADGISGDEIEAWVGSLESQGHDSFSIAFWLGCIQNFFQWAHSQGCLTSDPTQGVKLSLDEVC